MEDKDKEKQENEKNEPDTEDNKKQENEKNEPDSKDNKRQENEINEPDTEDKKKQENEKNEPDTDDNKKQENNKKKPDIDENAVLVEEALKSFCCYLYVGKGYPHYKAKPWNEDESSTIDHRLQCVEILASNKETELVPIDKIKLAMDSTLIRRPENLGFALATCARQKKSEKLRAAAYYFLAEHCKEWKYFISFIKYNSILSKREGSSGENGTTKNNGCGHGWRNAVNKWYLTQSPTSLVHLVTHHKGDHGWTHKDILKLSHPNTVGLEVEKRAIICYIIRGLKEAQKEYGNEPEVKKMLDHLNAVENFKKCKNNSLVAKLAKTGEFTIDQVHPKALKSPQVWLALLDRMDVQTILKHVPTLTNLGLLKKLSPVTRLVAQSLTEESNLQWNNILPGDVLSILTLYRTTYEVAGHSSSVKAEEEMKQIFEAIDEVLKLEKPIPARKKRNVIGSNVGEKTNEGQTKAKSKNLKKEIKDPKLRGPIQPDKRICDALQTALNLSRKVDITESSKRKYLVSMKLPGRRHSGKCVEAGMAIALPFVHRPDLPDDAVTLIGYEPEWSRGVVHKIPKEMSFDDALLTILQTKQKCEEKFLPMPGKSAVFWAYRERKKYDVIINITNVPPTEDINFAAGFGIDFGLSEARTISVSISKTPFQVERQKSWGSLTIDGFDPHVPWIIEAYVRGLF